MVVAIQRALVLNEAVVAPQVLSERQTPAPGAVPDLLGLLPAEERDAITLARTGFTYRDVAVALGIPEDAAKRCIRSGLQRLRAEMLRVAPATT